MLYGELFPMKTADGKEAFGFPCEIVNPAKLAVLRLPTSEEILQRLSKQITINHDMGRGNKAVTVPTQDADLVLFNKLRIDSNGNGVTSVSSEWDKYEAAKAISKITYARITGCERVGNQFEVTLDTYAGPTTHLLDGPLEEDMSHYRDTIVASRNLGHGKMELRYRHSAAIGLYDKFIRQVDGYYINPSDASGTAPSNVPATPADHIRQWISVVPAHHKFHVAMEVADAIDSMDPPIDPNS